MKIGILTFHCANNYGAVLQGYALQAYLKGLGHEVEIIDYRPEYLLNGYRPIRKYNWSVNKPFSIKILGAIKQYLMGLSNIKNPLKYTKLFSAFNKKYIILSNKAVVEPSINTDYDLYIVGSDQVWNPKFTQGIDDFFWGNFIRRKNSRLITYAVSSSYYSYDEDQKIKMSDCLCSFDAISVRERELGDYLKSNFNIDTQLVCDPTLLVDRSVWDEVAVEPLNKGYVLAYFPRSETVDVAYKIAKEKGLDVVLVYDILVRYNKKNDSCGVYSPEEFVGLFKYADYVVSSSFHGLAFSLILNKEFCVIGSGDSRDSRMLSILENVGLKERYVVGSSNMDTRMFDTPINYLIVNAKIDEFRQTSRAFLDMNGLDKKYKN